MKISRNWLQTYFKKEIPDATKLAEIFTFHAFEIEGIEKIEKSKDLAEDAVLDVKVLPDRAHYALSHRGIAGEISALTGLEAEERYVGPIEENITDKPQMTIEDPNFCKRYIARTISIGKMTTESPTWLKNALGSIGQRSINSIVDVTNYVMYDIGQPLHAFDADKVKGGLIVRPAKEGEKIVLLDGREITLTTDDSVIADEEGPLVIAGAKGGKRAEISETTTKIIIESANFHPTKVRRTSTKYDIRSDSSKRFENEITPELAMHGMNNISGLIQKMLPDAKFGPIVDVYPNKVQQTIFDFDPKYLKERLGIEISSDKAKEILKSIGISVKESGAIWNLTIPYERLDITIREDIVEEVGRIYGYDKVVGTLPPKEADNPKNGILPIFFISELIKSTLIDLGFSEVSLYSLVENGHVETAKPLARDKAFARSELSKGMIECVERNILNADLLGLESIKIFEIGHIFTDKLPPLLEKTHLVIGTAQIKKVKGLKAENLLDEAIKKLEEILGIKITGKVSSNKAGNAKVVEINLDALVKSYGGNFDLEKLNLGKASTKRYQKFSLYPFIVRDIAVFVPESISSEAVWSVIEKGIVSLNASDLLARHSLFDTFKKESRVSYAFRLIFQSMDKTLTDEEINAFMKSVSTGITKEGWEVR